MFLFPLNATRGNDDILRTDYSSAFSPIAISNFLTDDGVTNPVNILEKTPSLIYCF